MSDHINGDVLLIGTGYMGQEYVKVLQGLQCDFTVVGRGEESAKKLYQNTGVKAITGGIEKYLTLNSNKVPPYAIITVRVYDLEKIAELLIDHGVKYILLEKPGALDKESISRLKKKADIQGCRVYIAYNRRFYASVRKAQEMIAQDGGATSYYFEFTEWPRNVLVENVLDVERQHWFLSNSSHVVDLAFYLGGLPKEITTYKAGELSWHKSGASFCGAGVTENGATFCYQANWAAPGRWGVEIMTRHHRYILRPLEKLQIQEMDSIKVDFLEIDDSLDRTFKPGLYLQTKEFLANNTANLRLCTLEEQCTHFELFNLMVNE